MASFSVSTNMYLRNLYSADRTLINKATRAETKSSTLQKADQDALRKGIRDLADWDYEDDSANDKKSIKAKYYNKLKAFTDAYNYTLESGDNASGDDNTVKRSTRGIRNLSSAHEKDLSDLGISLNSKGYMSISSSALDNIDVKSFKKVFGSDSEYMKELEKYSKRVSRHIDTTA